MSIEETVRREVAETYTTPELRAAYRAGMSSAAAICDEYAAAIKKENSTKSGQVTMRGYALSGLIKQAGDRIWAMRETVRVRDEEAA